jgi:hypothetical protein
MRKKERRDRLWAKFSDTTGIYRRPPAGEPRPHPTLEQMLGLAGEWAEQTRGREASAPEAKANAEELLARVRLLRNLLRRCRAEDAAFVIEVASHAMASGMMTERLYVRGTGEDLALTGLEMTKARVMGGELVGGARRAKRLDWVPKAQEEAEAVWGKRPDLTKTAVAKQIAAKVGMAAGTIRQHIRKPAKS